MKSIVITGASTGIGYASAKEMLDHGYRVFANVRKEKDAKRLKEELGENCYPLIFDVNDQQAIVKAVAEVKSVVGDNGLFGLFNNAGIALTGPLLHQPLDDVNLLMQTNVISVIRVTRAFAPLLGARENCPHPPGTIINMSSVGGKNSMPYIGVYCASKHAVEGLSDALRRELMIYGIKVVILEPGAVVTPIWDKAPDPENTGYEDTHYQESMLAFLKVFAEEGKKGLPSVKLGKLVRKIMESKNPRNRYMVSPTPFVDKFLLRFLPSKVVDSMIAKSLKLRRRKVKDETQETILT